ncbi:3'-5' exonuclease [Ferrovibrio sp.]|uniref:3'-5' exonuclease n=1 Tax=Ferrovibrio sp. TaxID=1917215 RepID=UPI002B4B6641|nr:3'-5' exonuclease [Ferrovibrio sp.]
MMRQRLITGLGRMIGGIRSTPRLSLPAEHSFPADEPLSTLPVTVLDIETTGLNVARDRLLSIGALHCHGAQREAAPPLDLLVHPGVKIPKRATQIHGITDADVAFAPSFALIWSRLQAYWQGRVLIGHNIAFDLAVLRHEAERARLPFRPPSAVLDVCLLYAGLRPRRQNISLEQVAEDLGITVSGRHQALGDAEAAAAIWAHLLPPLGSRGIATLGAARDLMARQRDLIHGQTRAGWSVDLLLAS